MALLVSLALASDARLLPFGADDLGAGSGRPTVVYADDAWHRYTCADGGIFGQTSTDGAAWSDPVLALPGDVCEPSVLAVGSGAYTWLMAYSYDDPDAGRWIGLAGSTDGVTFTTIPDDHPTCYGPCGAPALLHVGEYFILNHTEHTADFDGMRVHHSTDGGLTWSSGLTHTLPDGADDPDIVYTPAAWFLVSKHPETDVVHAWSAPKIEGDKTPVGVMLGQGQPAFYRSEGGAGLGTEPRTLWITDGSTRARMALLDADDGAEPPAASCAAGGAVGGGAPANADGPANDGAFSWVLPGPDTCTIAIAASADFMATSGVDVAWDGAETVGVELDGVGIGALTSTGQVAVPAGTGEVTTVTLTVTTTAASTFSLYLVAAVGEGTFNPLEGDSDSEDSPGDTTGDDSGPTTDNRRCGCASAPGDAAWGGVALAVLVGARRRLPAGEDQGYGATRLTSWSS